MYCGKFQFRQQYDGTGRLVAGCIEDYEDGACGWHKLVVNVEYEGWQHFSDRKLRKRSILLHCCFGCQYLLVVKGMNQMTINSRSQMLLLIFENMCFQNKVTIINLQIADVIEHYTLNLWVIHYIVTPYIGLKTGISWNVGTM